MTKVVFQQVRCFLLKFPENLKRITTGSGFIPEIDGLRFLAIFPVVLQHFSERMLRVFPSQTSGEKMVIEFFSHGHVGVYIFFAISGFILALPFGRESIEPRAFPVSIKKYYLRRLTRLEPPYVITMTLLFFILIILQRYNFNSLFPHYLASLFYVHRYVYGEWTPINPPAWTLEIEVMFYLVAPLLTRGYFSIKNKLTRRSLLLLPIVIRLILVTNTTVFDNLYLTLFSTIDFFCVGILMADIYLTERLNENKNPQYKFDIIALVSITVLFATWTWDKNLTLKFIFLIALFITFYSCFRSIVINSFLKNKWITAIGGMCYSIYLIHLAFAEFFAMVWKKVSYFDSYLSNVIVGLVLFLPILFFVSTTFYLLIERPCMDPAWPQKLKKFLRSFAIYRKERI